MPRYLETLARLREVNPQRVIFCRLGANIAPRAKIVARHLVPVGKETDRHWEQGEDPSMLDPKLQVYGRTGRLVVLDEDERNELRKIGVRRLMRATKLTQKVIYSILAGKSVRKQTMASFRIGAESLSS